MDKCSCMSVTEMGRVLSLSKSAAYALANKPSFKPAFRLGTRILINRAALEEWISEQIISQEVSD